jgi:hypothetical protein
VQLTVNCDCVGAANLACNSATVTAAGGISQAAQACLEILPGPGGAGSREGDAEGPELSPSPGTRPAAPAQPDIQPGAPAQPGATFQPGAQAPIQSPAAQAPGNLTLSVTDDVDPAKVGALVTYRIMLTNRAAESDRQVLVRVNVPEQLSIERIRGAYTRYQDTLRFTPINELRAGDRRRNRARCGRGHQPAPSQPGGRERDD